jgi:hypothetical protein
VTWIALAAALGVYRVATALLFAAGMGALATTALSFLLAASPGAGADLIRNVRTLAVQVAAAALLTAVLSRRGVPSIAEIRSLNVRPEANHPAQVVLLAGLAIGAARQVPSLLAWFREDRVLLVEALGTERDPMRLDLVPAAILYSLPALAGVLLALFAVTSIGGSLAPRRPARRFLFAGVILQSGFVAVQYVIGRGVRDLGAAALRLLADAPPADAAGAIAWVGRHDAVARSMMPALAVLFTGYVAAAIIAWYLAGSASPAAAAVAAAPVSAPEPRAAAIAPAPAVIPPPATPFDQPLYVLQLRAGKGLAGLVLGRRFVEYTIRTIPRSSRAEFSFSWATGVLRREPDGPAIVRLGPAERHDRMMRGYVVSDPVSGALIGRLLPHAAEWQIVDRLERPVADLVRSSVSFHQSSYTITAGGLDLARLTAVMGASAASAEVQIEFLPAVDGRLDRTLAIALAALVEHQARRSRRV